MEHTIRKGNLGMLAVWTALIGLLSGCSAGWPHHYEALTPHVEARGFGKVIVVTRDQRPDIEKGEHPPQYVGTVSSAYGKPWDILTAGGRPLAQGVSSAVCNSLTNRGYECLPLVSGQADIPAEIEYLNNKHAPVRILFFTISHWKADVYSKTRLDYGLSLDVYNRNGRIMTSARVKGTDVLPSVAYFNPAQNASVVAPQAMQRYLEMLLDNKSVTGALSLVKEIDVLGAKY